MTQEQLGIAIGADKTVISKLELGKRQIGESKLKLLSKVLHVDPAEILGDLGSVESSPQKSEDAHSNFKDSDTLAGHNLVTAKEVPLSEDETELIEFYRELDSVTKARVLHKVGYLAAKAERSGRNLKPRRA